MTIPPDKRAGLRISLVRSHAAGLGAPIEPEVGVGGRDLPEGPHAGSGSQWGSRTSGSVTALTLPDEGRCTTTVVRSPSIYERT